jgi:hypothetical protein
VRGCALPLTRHLAALGIDLSRRAGERERAASAAT